MIDATPGRRLPDAAAAIANWAKVNNSKNLAVTPCRTYAVVGYGYVSVKHAVHEPAPQGPDHSEEHDDYVHRTG
jgi:hypothetical protein